MPLFIIRLSIAELMHMINVMIIMISITTRSSSTVEPMYSDYSLKDHKLGFMTNYCLMQVKSIADCSPGPALTYRLSIRSLFVCLYMFYCCIYYL